MKSHHYQSWGRYPTASQSTWRPRWQDSALPPDNRTATLLAYGNGRSYGDVCLNDGGTLLDMRGLNRLISFDSVQGILRCEAGMLLAEVIDFVVPQGWFPRVAPGTRLITIGGAIANDVHGKGHHQDGTFGCHLRCFELLRSDGQRLFCSPEENADWFRATIGGLGLTGIIVWAEIALGRIHNPFITSETLRYDNLEEFFQLSRESDRDYRYTVAWVDCLSRGNQLGRGLLMRGNHAPPLTQRSYCPAGPRLTMPLDPPLSLVNSLSLRAFNTLYYHKQWSRRQQATVPFEPFFFPLDGIGQWNRIYGPRGFLQYQCVVPFAAGHEAIREIMSRIAVAGSGSFLAVLKVFGDKPSPGLLSFPRPGVTLALDFPNHGQPTLDLLASLDNVVREARGAVYPAKDACMSAASFQHYFPQWQELLPFIDPRFSSSFWRRVTGNAS